MLFWPANLCRLCQQQTDFFFQIDTFSPVLSVHTMTPRLPHCFLSLSVFLSLLCPLQLVALSAQQLAYTSECLSVSLHACQFAWVASVLTAWCTVSMGQERPWGNMLLPRQRLTLAKWSLTKHSVWHDFTLQKYIADEDKNSAHVL